MIGRNKVLLTIMLSVFLIFSGRLVYLQIIMVQEYQVLSTQNFMVERRISPLRGRILAGDGTVLATNRIAYDLMYHGGEVTNWERIAYLIGIPPDPPVPPDPASQTEMTNGAVAAWNIPDRVVPAMSELLAGQGNLYLRERVERTYPTGLAPHVVGYTAVADPVRFPGYAADELVGVMGIEAGMERTLFGAAGARLVEVDHRRVTLRERVLVPAQPGDDVHLTIDPQMQRWAEEVIEGALPYINGERTRWGHPHATIVRGALLAIDTRTGGILAMASTPGFDPNVFTRRPGNPAELEPLLTDSVNFPLQNRAVEAYPPASIFKIVTSSTLMDEGYMRAGDRYECNARINYGGRNWENWTTSYRGNYTNVQAIADSCNTFYWHAAMDTPNFSVGWAPFVRDLMERGADFGFGVSLQLGLPEEKNGRLPDETWKRQASGEPWYPGFTLNSAIGQGDILTTPLQVLQFIHILANDGDYPDVHLVRQIEDRPVDIGRGYVAGSSWHVLREGMQRMVTDYGSNRWLGRPGGFNVSIAGKTGTAQNGRQQGLEHSWFMGYAPADAPEIAIVVFVENGGYSSSVAVPLAADFLKLYFNVGGMADAR